jgi:hypothetical protein
VRRYEKRRPDPSQLMIDTFHWLALYVAVLAEVESLLVVHMPPSDKAEDIDFHFLFSVMDTLVKDAGRVPCMDEDDVNTSLELKELDDNADDDDDAVEVHSTRWDVKVPVVDAVNDGNLPDVEVALPYF